MNASNSTFKPLHQRPELSATLPGFYYHDPMVFEKEQERIFARTWQFVAHRSQLPAKGDYICVDVAGDSIVVIRDDNDKIRAFYNVCQHRAHPVLTGRGRARARIVCPYHAWAYSLDGRLVSGRGIEKLPDFDKSCFGLKEVRLEEMLGFIFVNLDAGAVSLKEVAGQMFDDMANTLPWVKDALLDEAATGEGWQGSHIQANWKVLADNCRECYHCVPAHKAFVDMIDMNTYKISLRDGWARSEASLGKESNAAYDVSRKEPQVRALFWLLWPNTEFGILPGEKSILVFRTNPIGPEETCTSSLILSGDGTTIKKERLDYRWNVLWPEDENICKSVHEGLKSSGYRQGRFVIDPDNMGISEDRVHAFQFRYAEYMDLPIVKT